MVETRKAALLKTVIDEVELCKNRYAVIDYHLDHHSKKEACLWLVLGRGKEKWIELYYLEYLEDGWAMSDSYCELEMINYVCPIGFLELMPEAINPYFNESWREQVIKEKENECN